MTTQVAIDETLPLAFRIPNAAKAADMSEATIKRKIADGTLPSRLVGGCRIVLREDLERFLKGDS